MGLRTRSSIKREHLFPYANRPQADGEVSLAEEMMHFQLRMSKTSGLGSRVSCMCQFIEVFHEKQVFGE